MHETTIDPLQKIAELLRKNDELKELLILKFEQEVKDNENKAKYYKSKMEDLHQENENIASRIKELREDV